MQRLENTEIFQRVQRKLLEDKWYKPILDYSEASSKLNRVYLVTGCGSILLAILFYHFGIQLISSAVGFLYPGYQTIECLENFEVHEAKRWLTYWLVISAYNFLEILLFFLHWIPGYWIIKCAFYVWCYAAFPMNGSHVMYNLLIRPLFKKNQEAIGDAISHIRETAHTVYADSNMGVVKYLKNSSVAFLFCVLYQILSLFIYGVTDYMNTNAQRNHLE